MAPLTEAKEVWILFIIETAGNPPTIEPLVLEVFHITVALIV
jgi:hypothetical protein